MEKLDRSQQVIANIFTNSKDLPLHNIISILFYINDKILWNNYIYDIIRKIQLIDVVIHVTPLLKRANISKSFSSFKVGFNILLNYVWLCNFAEPNIKFTNKYMTKIVF